MFAKQSGIKFMCIFNRHLMLEEILESNLKLLVCRFQGNSFVNGRVVDVQLEMVISLKASTESFDFFQALKEDRYLVLRERFKMFS
jgi:hypothetical protein